MELEVGLKLTKIIDDFTSAELLVAKDRGGPLFLSRETDTMFILTAHLKGYRRRNIKIEINKDGTRIAISGERPVQEMVMVGWKMYKKEIEMRGFTKAFRIPTGVVLDKIKAKFNEEESVLTISMPKLVKGAIVGGGIEEVKEEEVAKGVSETVLVADEREKLQHENHGESSTEDRGEGDTNVEKLPEASEIGRGKEYEGLTHEKVEPAGSIVTIPEESKGEEIQELKEELKKESPEAETSTVEDRLKDDDRGVKTVESTKSVPDQTIQQPELPSPPSVEKGQVAEEHAIDKIQQPQLPSPPSVEKGQVVEEQAIDKIQQPELPSPPSAEKGQVVEEHANDKIPGVQSKMQIQESEKEETSQGIQEIDHTQTSDMEQLKDQCQHDKYQQVGRKEEIQEEEVGAPDKPRQEAKVDESAGVEKDENLSDGSNQTAKPPKKKSKLCVPIMAGSAFLVSLIVFVIHLIKAKNQPSNIKAKRQ